MVSAELSRYLHNGQRTSEGMVIASRESGVAIRNPKAPLCKGSWHGEAVTEGLLRGALHRRKTDSHDQFANWSRNDKVVRHVGYGL